MSERYELPPRLKDLLGTMAPRPGLGDPLSTGAVWERWAEIVGDEVARHAEPTSLRDGTLKIRTESPVWATEIGYLGSEIKTRINSALGRELVTEVSVWTGPGPIKGPAGRTTRTPAASEPPREAGPKDPVSAFENARSAWARRRSKRSS